MSRYGYDQEEENTINSEIIWTFDNVKKQLIDQYPNGRGLSEDISTVDGLYTWRVEFYPNGKERFSNGKVAVLLTLTNVKRGVSSNVEAECNYYLVDRKQNKNYAGRVERRRFTTYLSEKDSSFENDILKDCTGPLVVSIVITQFPQIIVDDTKRAPEFRQLSVGQISSATPTYSSNKSSLFSDEDYKVETVRRLY